MVVRESIFKSQKWRCPIPRGALIWPTTRCHACHTSDALLFAMFPPCNPVPPHLASPAEANMTAVAKSTFYGKIYGYEVNRINFIYPSSRGKIYFYIFFALLWFGYVNDAYNNRVYNIIKYARELASSHDGCIQTCQRD